MRWTEEAVKLADKALRSGMPADALTAIMARAELLASMSGERTSGVAVVTARQWYRARHDCGRGEWVSKPAQLDLFNQQPTLFGEEA